MKAAPTLDGRIRIDLESELDRMVLRAIPQDARLDGWDAIERLREPVDDGQRGEDWEDFVRPELENTFEGQLATIAAALAELENGEPLFIVRDQAEAWFGGLNQARLALEARYRLTEADPTEIGAEERSAWFRSHFYLQLQGLILEFLMKG